MTNNTPNGGQVTIAGAFAYDNVFLINGVDVNDNLFGTANNVFIEDAIEQTSVLTSGISAEYGRFTGGVINMITKSGGNRFSGSFRANLSNDSWTVETPREKDADIERPDKLNQNYEGTFGGPIVRDRLWFFGAGRWQDISKTQTLQISNLPFKTGPPKTGGSRSRAPARFARTIACRPATSRTPPIGPRAVPRSRSTRTSPRIPSFPNDLFVVSYNGVLSPKLLANFQVSQKQFGFRGSGGFDTDIHASPFITQGVLGRRAGRAALQRQLLRRDRPRGSRQLPVRRQPVVLPDDAETSDRTTSRAASSTSRRTARAATRRARAASSSTPTT